MCQLSYINLKNKKFNSLISLFLASHNSVLNPDGFGVFVNNRIYKSDMPGYMITNIKQICSTDKPIMMHVRKASVNSKNKENKAHPFAFGCYILMHNGTLEPKSGKIPDDMIDSEYFALELSKKGNRTVEALQETMKNFKGKFAFLIYNQDENSYYAVRGKTADLNIVRITIGDVSGFIINTETDTLVRALIMLENFYPDMKISKIEELDKESIYRVNDDGIEKVGELEENERASAYELRSFGKPWYYYEHGINHDKDIETLMDKLLESRMETFEDLLFSFHNFYKVSPLSVPFEKIINFLDIFCECD